MIANRRFFFRFVCSLFLQESHLLFCATLSLIKQTHTARLPKSTTLCLSSPAIGVCARVIYPRDKEWLPGIMAPKWGKRWPAQPRIWPISVLCLLMQIVNHDKYGDEWLLSGVHYGWPAAQRRPGSTWRHHLHSQIAPSNTIASHGAVSFASI